MRYDPNRHHRHSIRLKRHNYGQAGEYFVTICVQDRHLIFGTVVDASVCLTATGEQVQLMWDQLPERFAGVVLGDFVIMPNHLHAIIRLEAPQFPRGIPLVLGEVLRTFKAAATRLIRQTEMPEFAWQRNYFEHIIRDEHDWLRIRQYIANNPTFWKTDSENPNATPP